MQALSKNMLKMLNQALRNVLWNTLPKDAMSNKSKLRYKTYLRNLNEWPFPSGQNVFVYSILYFILKCGNFQHVYSVMPCFIVIHEGFSYSFPLLPDSNWRPSSYRAASITSRRLCRCQVSCEEHKCFLIGRKCFNRDIMKIFPPLDLAHARTVRLSVVQPVCGWEREREIEMERAVRGAEMRAQHVAWCVTMATAVCIPKITIHTHT